MSSKEPESKTSETIESDTKASEIKESESKASETKEPESKASETKESDSKAYEIKESKELKTKASEISTRVPARYVLVMLGFFGFFILYVMRINLSVAIIAMVKPEYRSNNTLNISNIPCPELFKEGKDHSNHLTNGEFEWSQNIQGTVLAAFFYGYIITLLPGGFLAGHFGGKWVLAGGMVISSIFALLTPILARWNVWSLVVARFFQGLGQGVTYPSMHFLLGQWAPKMERNRIGVIIYTGSNMGSVTVLTAAGVLCETIGWPSVFYISGALGFVWFILWTFLVFDTPEDHPQITKEELYLIREGKEVKTKAPTPWKSILTSVPVWGLVACHFGNAWSLYLFLTEVPNYLSRVLHFDIHESGYLTGLTQLVLSILSVLSCILVDHLREYGKLSITSLRKISNTIGCTGAALFLIAVAFSGCRRNLIVFLLCCSMAMSGVAFSSFLVTQVDLSPDYAGNLFGITGLISNATGFIIPQLTSWLLKGGHTVHKWTIVYLTSSGTLIITAIIFNIFGSSELQSWGISK